MPEPVRNFQHYEVLRQPDGTPWELGRGAMGVTYKAFDVNLCCEVALKVVSSALVENSEARERFVREARAAAALRHRNVASVYHLGNDGEHFFYAMEFINGETLDALVRRGGPLSVADTLRVVLQVARALAAAERQGLVHRDIKPANLMVTHEDADEETVVKVIDFGLARQAAGSDDAAPLTIGGFVGTPQYASPEQLEERPLDARSDLYSLGITAWFLLTGRVPFTGSLATICQLQLTQPPPWEQLSPEVPTCVRGLLGHLLAKDPARRPQNAAELRAEIEACLDKVQGMDRRRDLHLPAPSLATEGRGESRTKAAGRAPGPGTVLNSRYRLLREIGGRNGVRVFQARDEAASEKPVAVKILPETNAAGRAEWQEEVRLVRAAAHPNLVQVLALEQCASPKGTFLVEEWLRGCTLRDLLAGRGGALPVAEALQVLAQAAAAADHAARCRLEHLDLAVADVHLHFLMPSTTDKAPSELRTLLGKPLAEWPDWVLKIHAFRPAQDALNLATWAGGVTLVPGTRPTDTPSPADAARRHVQALATVVYELLGGTPTNAHYVSLAVLNEEANAVLRQALAGGDGMASGWQLHESLARAVGEEPARGNDNLRSLVAAPLPVPVDEEEPPPREESRFVGNGSTVSANGGSVAALFHDHDDPGPDDQEHETAGSAWDRLALVTEKRAHPARWVAGIAALGIVFGLGFVGVLAWLWQQSPTRTAAAAPPLKRRPAVAASPANRPVTRQPTPTPLPVRPPDATPASVVAAVHENRSMPVVGMPSPLPSAVGKMENLPPSAAPAETTVIPAATPAPLRERYTMVRLDSVPEGAQIRLGGEALGTTPCRVRLPPGEHQLIARYQNWPETRQIVHIEAAEVRAAVEIRLMRPDLVPGSAAQPSGVPDNHLRRVFAPAARRLPPVEASAPTVRPAPVVVATPTPGVSEPEVRPAGRVLTPFRIDEEPAGGIPQSQPTPSVDRQPFSADDTDGG